MTTTPSPPSPVALRAVPDRELRFRELFEATFRPLLGYALRRVASPDDAADIVAETMLVACAWLDQWTAATKSGDTAKATEAVTAMKTSHNWPILKEMAKDGAYPDVLWEYADRIAKNQAPDGYVDGLGCK